MAILHFYRIKPRIKLLPDYYFVRVTQFNNYNLNDRIKKCRFPNNNKISRMFLGNRRKFIKVGDEGFDESRCGMARISVSLATRWDREIGISRDG